MKNSFRLLLPAILFSCLFQSTLSGIDTKNTRLMSQPAISADHIAFIYAEDLWLANPDGSGPLRLTVDDGIESDPYFSPDGRLIAFSAQYDGNTDVFVIPVEGGVPVRLTWHPGNDIVRIYPMAPLCFCHSAISFQKILPLYTVGVARIPEKLKSPMHGSHAIHLTGNQWLTPRLPRNTSSGRTTGEEPYQRS
jgi:tricorn protease-like protein